MSKHKQVRSTQHHTRFWTDDPEDIDELAKLPADQIVTAGQLRMKPGQRLAEKAKELGVTMATLRLWHAEWKGSQYDPDYVIRRAGHSNWQRTKWADRDWVEAVRQQIAKGQHRHVGDLCIELGIPAATVQVWSMKHAEFEKVLWHSGVPYPKQHWRDFISWVRHAVIDDYRKRKADYIAAGMDETKAMHTAADEAVNDLKHKTRQRRRVERDVLLGVGGQEEIARRHQKGSRLSDAHSKRIAKRLVQIGRWMAMERGLREVGTPEREIKSIMDELMGAFKRSDTEGQAHWKKVRETVLRRRKEAERDERARKAEARIVKKLPGVRQSKYVKAAIEGRYGAPERTSG